MEAKIIRTPEQHKEYIEEVHRLIVLENDKTKEDRERLELLSVLIETYENNKSPVEAPSPIDAIKFRMREQNLKQADLIPYFGSSSRVSEVLNNKRPLTVQMIRELTNGLGLSADTLVGANTVNDSTSEFGIQWSKFPIKEIAKRGWIGQYEKSNKSKYLQEKLKDFFAETDLQFGIASFRRSLRGGAYSPASEAALYAWLARIIQLTRIKKPQLTRYEPGTISNEFLREIAQLSWFEHGPEVAIEFLEKHGIAVVIEPHLKGTLLDGAALEDEDGTPIIGLTLRHDRLDNFWFTLMHEVVHVWKHLGEKQAFLDNLDETSEDRREAEANRLAKEAFIPRSLWKRSEAFVSPSVESIDRLSRELSIHPAIVAGRLRRDKNNYRIFTDLVGQGLVRKKLMRTEEENHE